MNRSNHHLTKQALRILNEMNIGWGKSIKEALTEYDLPTDHNTIKNITRRQWTKIVKEKIEIKNLKKLLDDCHKTMDGNQVPKRTRPRVDQ